MKLLLIMIKCVCFSVRMYCTGTCLFLLSLQHGKRVKTRQFHKHDVFAYLPFQTAHAIKIWLFANEAPEGAELTPLVQVRPEGSHRIGDIQPCAFRCP